MPLVPIWISAHLTSITGILLGCMLCACEGDTSSDMQVSPCGTQEEECAPSSVCVRGSCQPIDATIFSGDSGAGSDASPPSYDDTLTARAESGGDVVVEAGATVWIDGDATLGTLVVKGELRCGPNVNATLHLSGIVLVGDQARFQCGTESSPFGGRLEVIIDDDRRFSEADSSIGDHVGSRGVVVMHGAELSLFGDAARSAPVRLNGTVAAGARSFVVSDPVNWQVGDSIVITSTGFDRKEIEKRVVESVDGTTVTVTDPLGFLHYGEIQTFDDVADDEQYILDQRAYVVNLNRAIAFRAGNDEWSNMQHGGHLMVMMGGKAFVDSVEFQRFGQMGKLGRYPFHWHLSGNVDGQFIRRSAIHDSFNRCIVVHSTDRARVVDNVCYNHFGHGFFLEEGNEQNNILSGNIGILSKKVPENRALLVTEFNTLPADRFPGPSTFWIPHPNNDVRDNVAIGSEGSGFWMAFRDELVCSQSGCEPPSAGQTPNIFPKRSDTLKFDNNIAASCVTGITWDGAADGQLIDNPLNPGKDFAIISSHYRPRNIPTFNGLIAYKNSAAGIYFRGEQVIYRGAILADNGTNAWYAYNQVVQDSLIVGVSASMTEADWDYHVTPPPGVTNKEVHRRRFEGVRIYDGPFVLDNVYFAGYPAEILRRGPIDFTPVPIQMTGGAERWVNHVERVSFESEPFERINMRWESLNWEDAYVAGIRDVDGDLTGEVGALIRPRHPLNDDESCVEWSGDAYLCNYRMGHIRLFAGGSSHRQRFTVTRSDGASISPMDFSLFYNKLSVILDGRYDYEISDFNVRNSSEFSVKFTSEQTGDMSPVMRLTQLQNVPCDLNQLTMSGAQRVDTVEQVASANQSVYAAVNGAFVFAVKANQTKPNLWMGTPDGLGLFSIGCMSP